MLFSFKGEKPNLSVIKRFFSLQVLAGEHLMGRRDEWGLKEKWEGNYLGKLQENPASNAFTDAVMKYIKNDGLKKVRILALI